MLLKVCGMREPENLQSLIALEPDFIGFIFYDKSKRFVADFPQIDIPLYIKKVGVFVNETIENVVEIVNEHKLDYVQLHGDESPNYIEDLIKSHQKSNEIYESFQLGIIKAFSVDDNFDFNKTDAYQKECDFLLFDTKGKDYGGNGVKFNWSVLLNYKGETPYLLSGGISKNDVQQIKVFVDNSANKKCVGLDVNSGFEIQPGLKNLNDINEFKQNL